MRRRGEEESDRRGGISRGEDRKGERRGEIDQIRTAVGKDKKW